MRTILIRFPIDQADELSLIHRLRNYGETVYHYTRNSLQGAGEVDLEELDAAAKEFSIRGVSNSKVRRLRKWVQEEAARQNLLVTTEVQ